MKKTDGYETINIDCVCNIYFNTTDSDDGIIQTVSAYLRGMKIGDYGKHIFMKNYNVGVVPYNEDHYEYGIEFPDSMEAEDYVEWYKEHEPESLHDIRSYVYLFTFGCSSEKLIDVKLSLRNLMEWLKQSFKNDKLEFKCVITKEGKEI